MLKKKTIIKLKILPTSIAPLVMDKTKKNNIRQAKPSSFKRVSNRTAKKTRNKKEIMVTHSPTWVSGYSGPRFESLLGPSEQQTPRYGKSGRFGKPRDFLCVWIFVHLFATNFRFLALFLSFIIVVLGLDVQVAVLGGSSVSIHRKNGLSFSNL